MKDQAAARRRSVHEALCRIAQQAGIPPSRIDVPWMTDVVLQLEEAQIGIEQALVLGTYIAGVARIVASQQAVSN